MKNSSSPPTVSVETAHLIRQLRENLKAEFGCDFSFSIMARGHYIAASNAILKEIHPTIRNGQKN